MSEAEKIIAIKGFRMPERCSECMMLIGGWCAVAPPEIDERVAETVDKAFEQKKPEWCPLVEVKPVERSRWLSRQRNGYKIYECAHCGKCVEYVCDHCPDCGYEMDKSAGTIIGGNK